MTITSKIPSDIYRKILAAEKDEEPSCRVRYYPYFELQGGALAIATVGVKSSSKKTKGKRHKCLYIKKATVHVVGEKNCFIRDIDFHGMGGYIIEFSNEPYYDTPRKRVIVNQYAETSWCNYIPAKYYRIYNAYRRILNLEFLKTLPEYKYCGYDGTGDALDYLTRYKENPKMELISKLVSPRLAMSKRIVGKAAKDKAFITWLKTNVADINRLHVGVPLILSAYAHNKTVAETVADSKIKQYFYKTPYIDFSEEHEPAKVLYHNADAEMKERIIAYLKRHEINGESYNDYLKALRLLRVDMTDTKNLFPIDWKYWSEVRLNQYATKVAERDQKKNAELNLKIKAIAKKYKKLAGGDGAYIAIIADSKTNLIYEGEMLHHCVGRMDYDQRIAKERSLIFFIRTKAEPTIPLVTVEFSIEQKKVLQCYGAHDKRPGGDIEKFVYDVWQPKARRALEQIQRKAV